MNSKEDEERREAERLQRALSGKLHRAKPAAAKKWTTDAPSNSADLKKAKSTSNVNEPVQRHPAAVPVHHEAPVEVVRHEVPVKDVMADEKELKKQAEEEEARMARFMSKRGMGNLVQDKAN